ncbi:NAD(P)/FAD-dependent oxidoreductase [Embleya sp. NBC_00896]|uniref:flavin-containing monooxygenase n=1 Tax=Embleya sp. NBC_00896 TaxID=2975961 RepID=UPI002F9087D1|nr:NAD(P)/FAD-dependent oxidoreductase [Embleya sp. NBC_00896]
MDHERNEHHGRDEHHDGRREVEVLVIGAGLSGVGAAITLRKAGLGDVVVLEKSERLGGTWRDSVYPGCGCDVPSMLYEYSFAPHDWSRSFAGRQEILEYLESTAAAHGLDEVIRYGVEVLSGRWDAHAHRWRLDTSAGAYVARSLVVATGPWHTPRYPDIAGLADFPGTVFHSARWNRAVDLTWRRVAVIGTGASTVQFLPEIQSRAARVEVFQRTAPWVLPKPDHALPPAVRRFLHRPLAHGVLRGVQHWTQEAIGLALRHPWILPPLEAAARRHMRGSITDPVLREAVTPDYRLGGRRLLTSDAYYRALTRPNVRLHPTAVTEVRGDDVIGADGTRARADTIILASGYHIGDLAIARNLHGAHGETLHQTWQHGRRAYLGTSVGGYPNLFLLLGPNVLSGTSAVPTVLEAQLRYIVGALTRLRHGGHTALDVLPEVQRAHNAAVQEALRTTVYATAGARTGYYFSPPGLNTFCWPWSTRRLLKRLHTFDPAAYAWHTTGRSDVRLPAQGDAHVVLRDRTAAGHRSPDH